MQRPATDWTIARASRAQSIDDVRAALLALRGLSPADLECRLADLEADMEAIRDLDAAAERVAAALGRGEEIVVVGDYDCDGLTSVAQVVLFLRAVGHRRFAAVTPTNRAEGYGMPLAAVTEHPDAGLFLVLDCGSFDREPVAAARARGADVVVLDHHEVSDPRTLAPASILVNPKHPRCSSPFKDYATAGLVLLFLARLRRALDDAGMGRPALDGDFLALAAVGTIADMMPLTGANRTLVHHGLQQLNRGASPPLQGLRAVAGLTGRTLSAGHIGFQIAPRLNAAARVADARAALDLLLAEDEAQINRYAHELDRLNRDRQRQVDEISGELLPRLEAMAERRTIVLADTCFPLGINGILAQRVVREVHRPAVVLQVFPDTGLATGSARSIPGFDLYGALEACAGLLHRWGGHAMAAGLTVRLEHLEALRARFEAVALEVEACVYQPTARADLELDPALIGPELHAALEAFEPYGVGNPRPQFALREQKITGTRTFGSAGAGDHLELTLEGGLRGVLWGGARRAAQVKGATVDLVCGISWNEYRGTVQLEIKDLGPGLFAPPVACGAQSVGES